ncbi:hypothetical protein [Sediminibacillus massiliensis]|uniref:hypothetical protein n=1 Tax=Sediminibacillus massiliensis TaxID=1926277 RepID=UPI00098877F7|nr:hypothetical protein [Sediminibacillus massiliensis]
MIDQLHLQFLSPVRLTKTRQLRLSNLEAIQILEDLENVFYDFKLTDNLYDLSETNCIVITHTTSQDPTYRSICYYDLKIEADLIEFIRTHEMPGAHTYYMEKSPNPKTM